MIWDRKMTRLWIRESCRLEVLTWSSIKGYSRRTKESLFLRRQMAAYSSWSTIWGIRWLALLMSSVKRHMNVNPVRRRSILSSRRLNLSWVKITIIKATYWRRGLVSDLWLSHYLAIQKMKRLVRDGETTQPCFCRIKSDNLLNSSIVTKKSLVLQLFRGIMWLKLIRSRGWYR